MSNEKRDVLEAKKKMKELVFASNREEQIARIINETYDPEIAIPEVIPKWIIKIYNNTKIGSISSGIFGIKILKVSNKETICKKIKIWRDSNLYLSQLFFLGFQY